MKLMKIIWLSVYPQITLKYLVGINIKIYINILININYHKLYKHDLLKKKMVCFSMEYYCNKST